jgi:hypothetical protein
MRRWSRHRPHGRCAIALPGIGLSAAFAGVLVALPCLAEPPDAGAPPPLGVPDAGASTWASCVEHVPSGASRPKIVEAFPSRGTSGWAATLEITVEHGKGESVLPEGFKTRTGNDAAKALAAAGFVLPEADAGAGPTIETKTVGASATTKLRVPFVPLPKEPGRNAMILPPVPVAIARASGELVTVCTAPHPILVEDPIANDPDPKVHPNPDPRPQREEWVLAKQLAIGAAVGAVIAALAAFLLHRWSKRPKPVPYVPPKLPWIAALEELDAIRRSPLLPEKKFGEHFDRVSDCVRRYLGARYGFDGLETTTDEMRQLLRRVRPPVPELATIGAFLADCDLVKFARVEPMEQDCLDALARGETIVRQTMPARTQDDADEREEASP